ncbi:MAG: type restriction modification enzyme, subunit [Proteobacteria bacterium]|nr:type restriction modification enzyme, subunit [Pseudomonadota bacterium]
MIGRRNVLLGKVAKAVSVRASTDCTDPVYSVTKHAGMVPSSEYFKKQVFSRDIEGYKVVRRGQFAYATIHLDEGSIGLLDTVDRAVVSPMYTVFETDSAQVYGPYLLRLLKSERALSRYQTMGNGSVHRRRAIPFETLEKLEIALPDVEEQKRIAAILDKADSLRRKRRQAIRLADDFLRAVFLDMFGDPLTNPKGWPVSELKALGQVSTGRTPPGDKPGMFGGETPFVTPGDLESEAPAKRSLTEAGVAEVNTVRSGAALVCCIGATIGKMGKATKRSAFNQQINAVEWNGLIDDDYGLAALRFFKAEIARQGASTTLPILKKSSFEKLRITVPPIKLQQAFTAQVATAERLRSSSNRSLAEIESLQAALQNESFA